MLLELYTPEVDAKVPWGNQFWMGAVTEVHMTRLIVTFTLIPRNIILIITMVTGGGLITMCP